MTSTTWSSSHDRSLPDSTYIIYTTFFKKMGHPRPLFHLISVFSKTNNPNFTTNYCKKCQSSIQRQDLNSQPSDYESPPLITRPGLPLYSHNFFYTASMICLWYYRVEPVSKQPARFPCPLARRMRRTAWAISRSSRTVRSWDVFHHASVGTIPLPMDSAKLKTSVPDMRCVVRLRWPRNSVVPALSCKLTLFSPWRAPVRRPTATPTTTPQRW